MGKRQQKHFTYLKSTQPLGVSTVKPSDHGMDCMLAYSPFLLHEQKLFNLPLLWVSAEVLRVYITPMFKDTSANKSRKYLYPKKLFL